MKSQLTKESLAVLDYVRAHPETTSNDIADALTATHTKLDVTSALYTLYSGRYLKRVKRDKKADNGMTLFQYTIKSENPRMLRKKGKKKHAKKYKARTVQTLIRPAVKHVVEPGTAHDVEIMIAVKGSDDTVVMTIAQAKALVAQLKDLGV